MTPRVVTIGGFGLVLIAAGLLEFVARTRRIPDIPRLDEALGVAQRTRLGRATTFVVWFWLGWHFLAR